MALDEVSGKAQVSALTQKAKQPAMQANRCGRVGGCVALANFNKSTIVALIFVLSAEFNKAYDFLLCQEMMSERETTARALRSEWERDKQQCKVTLTRTYAPALITFLTERADYL